MRIHAITEVKKQLAYRPFRPFSLQTVGGTRIYVERAEWFHEVPDGPLLITETDGTTITWWFDLVDIIEVENPQPQ